MTSTNERQLPLADVLSKKTVSELRDLAKGNYVRGVSKMKKAELIDSISLALQDQDRLAELLYVTDPSAWALFHQAAVDGIAAGDPDDPSQYEFFVDLCYLYPVESDGAPLFAVPTEVRETFKSLMADGFGARKARFDLLHAYALAATNLYGVIRQDDFISLFNQQNREKTDDTEVFQILIRYIAVDAPYCFWEEFLVCASFEENDFQDVPDLIRQIGQKPRYIPPKAEFLRYADYDYYEQTPHTEALTLFLKKGLHLQQQKAQEIVDEIHFACVVDTLPRGLFEILAKHDIPFSTQQAGKLAELFAQVSNNTRLWSNNGHTPLELHKRFAPPSSRPQPVRKEKIGRNEPCPCGSGKKYKKCCGR